MMIERTGGRVVALAATMLGLCLLLLPVPAEVMSAPAFLGPADLLAPQGCAMAHCDQRMSDQDELAPPLTASVVEKWHDQSPRGSDIGIGCSSNGSRIACSFKSDSAKKNALVAFGPMGQKLWWSRDLDEFAWTSAPMVAPDGSVIVADSKNLSRFDPSGNVLWSTAHGGGIPISPNVTDNGTIFLATAGGPLSVHDAASGALLAKLPLQRPIAPRGIYDTENTPAIRGNRAYISTQLRDPSTRAVLPYGRLYAVDINHAADGSASINVAWFYPFRAPSGMSPLVINDGTNNVIYFDGSGDVEGGSVSPYVFAVKDLGTSPQLLWQYPMANTPQASPAHDPRGGLWVFDVTRPDLIRLDEKRDETKPGKQTKELQRINLDDLVGEAGVHLPSSVMSITNTGAPPIMLVSATAADASSSYVLAIDLNPETGSLKWKFRVDEGKGIDGVPSGQYPIAKDQKGRPVIVFTTHANGVWGITAPE